MRALLDDEIIEQGAGSRDRLGANAGPSRHQILGLDLGEQASKRLDKGGLAERAVHLSESSPPVFSRHCPEPPEQEDLPGVREVEIGLLISLSRQCEYRVRSGLHLAVNRAREMDAQEGKARIGHGIDEATDQASSLGNDHVVLASKRDDEKIARSE